jgi:hypothetical protein
MTATTLQPAVRSDATWLRTIRIGTGLAVVGLAVLAMTLTFWTTSSQGDFQYTADYWLTMPALPIGVGLVMHAYGVHRLQHGRDGRLGRVGVWVYALCSAELVVQCMASAAVGAELRWGPSYLLCALGSFVGLVLLAAGSWRVGLVPRWMLGIWPPLALFGSWAGQGLIPLVLGAFLVLFVVVLGRRVEAARV